MKIWTDKVKREIRFDNQQKIHTLKVTKEFRRKKKKKLENGWQIESEVTRTMGGILFGYTMGNLHDSTHVPGEAT